MTHATCDNRVDVMPRNLVLVGDAAEQVRHLPSDSVDMVMTSPPYFRLRDYGHPQQLGMEAAVTDWVRSLHQVAAEIHRVLTPTGSLWLNVADTYANHPRQGAGRKSLLLGPERLALALAADGWLLRNKIVWAKPNHLPTSARDRLACSWEALYVFVKQPHYFFDLDSLRQPHTSRPPKPRPRRNRQPPRESWRGSNSEDTSGLAKLHAEGRVGHPLGKNPGDVWQINAGGYRSAHHATFPVALAERAIRAGCPEARCSSCRAPWRRSVQRTNLPGIGQIASRGTLQPDCACSVPSEPGLVLDPFFGAGSSAVAAEQLGRDWLGIELNPSFAELAQARLAEQRTRLGAATSGAIP